MNKTEKRRLYSIIAMISAVAVLLVIYFITASAKKKSENQNQPIASHPETIYAAQFDPKDITGISYTLNGETIDMEFSDELYKWTLKDHPEFPLEFEYPAKMATAISTIICDRFVESSTENFEKYGLDSPYLRITASYGGENPASQTYLIGIKNDFSQNYYFNIEGTPDVYLIAEGLLPYFEYSLLDMAVKDTLPVLTKADTFEINEVLIGGAEAEGDIRDKAVEAVSEASVKGLETAGFSLGGFTAGDVSGIEFEDSRTVEIHYAESEEVTDQEGTVSSTVHVEKQVKISLSSDLSFIRAESGMIYSVDPAVFSEVF